LYAPSSGPARSPATSAACSGPLLARHGPAWWSYAPPSSPVTTPPASRISTTPPATSQALLSNAQYPSNRPAATYARFNAVERVHDPGRRATRGGPQTALALFAEEVVIRERPEEELADRFLGGDVGLGDEVGPALLADAEPGPPGFEDGGAAAGGRLGGDE